MEDLKLTVAKNMKIRRNELGMTMEELAAKIGYKTRSSIYRIEKGLADIPNSKVSEIAAALDTTPAYLLGIDEELVEDIESKIPRTKPSEYQEPLSVDENVLLLYYRSLNESGKAWVKQCAEMASKTKEYTL